jgi:hypothetical protein
MGNKFEMCNPNALETRLLKRYYKNVLQKPCGSSRAKNEAKLRNKLS